ncbi:hypothetical protein BT69DRAFT_1356147 [Atractiella rhizophila]|nr:hypothetical protein BT69DRAFT_1356147 [Atractiella rhizophila]
MDEGSVVIEGGVTFLTLANWLHERNASLAFALVNWNITIAGALAMGAHRSSLKEHSSVGAAALAVDIVNGKGELVHIEKDENDDRWLGAVTSLGVLGAIVRVKFAVVPDFKVYANQKILSEDAVLNGDVYGLISPYPTANFWWWPGLKKFHYRYYDVVATSHDGNALQNTFSLSDFEAGVAKGLLETGSVIGLANLATETTFFGIWSFPNFRNNDTQQALLTWPTYGYAYPVLIGGLYPDQKPEWELGLHGYTLELAFPVTMANAMLKRVRAKFDESAAKGKFMAATYRSGINIKFGKSFNDLIGQTHESDYLGADWSKGTIMFDFPSYRPNSGVRYNEPFYHDLAQTLIEEFPCRPHWTKNSRDIYALAKNNIDPERLARFKAVRQEFDPNNIFKSVISEILGV